jgi:hypothetical protein
MKLSLPPKLVEKLVWVPVILFCKISFPVTHLMPYSRKLKKKKLLPRSGKKQGKIIIQETNS